MFEKLKRFVSGARTVPLYDLVDPCLKCGKTGCRVELDVDSLGHRERITVFCPSCGPIKHLYSKKPEPRFETLLTEAVRNPN